jgi:signal transduction histidine kinase
MAGVLVGHAAATRRWEPADQDLLEFFAASVALALRDAELLARVEEQNARLVVLDAEKDDFLRGISHNLQTPLARIRAYADQLASEGAGETTGTGELDRRPAIIAEQSERLSRMVRQLLTVSRLDSGVLRPVAEVFALGPRVRRAWEALGAGAVPFELVDEAGGWLALADADQVDQVLWGLLDNAAKYGARAPVRVRLTVDAGAGRVAVTVADGGPGVADADRDRLFERYARGGRSEDRDGTGLGLYVGRALARANGGDLVLEEASGSERDARAAPTTGAAFTLMLPAEAPIEA